MIGTKYIVKSNNWKFNKLLVFNNYVKIHNVFIEFCLNPSKNIKNLSFVKSVENFFFISSVNFDLLFIKV